MRFSRVYPDDSVPVPHVNACLSASPAMLLPSVAAVTIPGDASETGLEQPGMSGLPPLASERHRGCCIYFWTATVSLLLSEVSVLWGARCFRVLSCSPKGKGL